MNTAETEPNEFTSIEKESLIHLPSGLLGFERIKRFILTRTDEASFCWFQAQDQPSLRFLLISPFEVLNNYAPDIPTEDVRSLGIECPDDVLLLNIVTLRPGGRSTVNLKGPLVINRFSLIAKQVIPTNSSDYSVQHPLPNEAAN